MQLQCKLCKARFISKLVGVPQDQKFADVWQAVNIHIAKEHKAEAEPDVQLLHVVAPAIATLRAMNTFIEHPQESLISFVGPGNDIPVNEQLDCDYILEVRDKQREQLLDFVDGKTPTPKQVGGPRIVVPMGRG